MICNEAGFTWDAWNLVFDEKVSTALSIFVYSLICDVLNNFGHMLCSLCWLWTRSSFVCLLMRSVPVGADSVITLKFSAWCFVLSANKRFLQYSMSGCLEPLFFFIILLLISLLLWKNPCDLRWYCSGWWVYTKLSGLLSVGEGKICGVC